MARTAVITGTATAVHGAMTGARTSQQQPAADQAAPDTQAQATADQAAAQAQPAPASPAAAPDPGSGDDVIAKIRQLGELKQQGLLSDEEFAALKAKLIATA
ncbi:MAG: SHOCT domain-containing protein [Streptosporangiaceae bacterium]